VRRIVAAALVVTIVIAVAWYLSSRRGAPTVASGGARTTTAGSGALAGSGAAAAARGEAPGANASGDLPQLDCTKPAGDVVRVGSAAITADDFCRELTLMAGPATDPPSAVWWAQARQLRDRLVDVSLVRQAIAAAGNAITDGEVESELANVRSRSPGTELGAAELDGLRRQIRARLELARLISLRAGGEPTEADLRDAYDREPARYGEPGEAHVTAFAKRLSAAMLDDDVAAAEEQAEAFVPRVQRGTEPAAAAATTGLTALAPFVLEDHGIEPALRSAAFGLSPGGWSAPTRTNVGVVVLRLDSVRMAKILPFAQVRDRVRASMLATRQTAAEELLLRELRAATVITDLVAW
jgi:hypothetical protein